MKVDPEEVNPYASPALPALKSETSFSDDLAKQRKAAKQDRASWTAICMLIGCAVFIIGIFLVSASNKAPSDYAIFRSIGVCMVIISLNVFFAGPLLWPWIAKNK